MAKLTNVTIRVCEIASRISRPKQQEIARLAYRHWLARSFRKGSPQEDWLRALREVSHQSTTRLKGAIGRASVSGKRKSRA
jgi:hypothetical protein